MHESNHAYVPRSHTYAMLANCRAHISRSLKFAGPLQGERLISGIPAKMDIKFETEIHHWCFGPAECENTPMIVSENIKDVFKNYWKLHNRSINVSKMLMRKLTWYPKESYTLPQLRKIDSSLTKTTSTPFSSQPQRCLTFWWIEPKMLLNKYRQIFTGPLYPFCIFTSMRHLFIWLRLGLFVSYLRDLFFIFIFIINYTISLK